MLIDGVEFPFPHEKVPKNVLNRSMKTLGQVMGSWLHFDFLHLGVIGTTIYTVGEEPDD